LLDIDLRNFTADITFDRADQSSDGELIAGGYYFVRPTTSSTRYFEKLNRDLRTLYVPDNTYMTTLCADRTLAVCGYVPFKWVSHASR
jgi:hypothetical protein